VNNEPQCKLLTLANNNLSILANQIEQIY
jgi:hypothetical protein